METMHTLNEVCKLSALKATTALSKFLNVPVGVEMKPVEVRKISDIYSLMQADEKVISLFQTIKGEITGGSFLLYQEDAALNICDILFHRKHGTTIGIDNQEKSALSEVANIVVGNFLTTFAQSLRLKTLMHQSAVFNSGTYARICESFLPLLNKQLEHEIIVLISFDFKCVTITEYALFLLEKEKIDALLQNFSEDGSM